MSAVPEFENYDQRVADGIVAAGKDQTGLPGYLGIRHVSAGPGTLVAELDVRPELLQQFGTVHGGVMSALCDHVLGSVCYPVIPRGAWAATTEFKLNLLASVKGGTLKATSKVVALTKRTAVVQIEIENDGRVCCLAQGTVLVVERS